VLLHAALCALLFRSIAQTPEGNAVRLLRGDQGSREHHQQQLFAVFTREFHHRQASSATPCREKFREAKEQFSAHVRSKNTFLLGMCKL
jgi:hypothetical protein